MLTYSFDDAGSSTLYEHLYRCIKNDILSGTIAPREKLPSKRSFAKNLSVSTVTIENAYGMLLDEGYIYSIPKKGYYVSDIAKTAAAIPASHSYSSRSATEIPQSAAAPDSEISRNQNALSSDSEDKASSSRFSYVEDAARPFSQPFSENVLRSKPYFADFVSNQTTPDKFPFSTWVRLLREIIHDRKEELMINSPSGGIPELQEAICDYLYQFRGMKVSSEQIIIGAGTEYLYSLLIQLLGRDKQFAVENPGYRKISLIYEKNGVRCSFIPMDHQGVRVDALNKSGADVIHISPSHHFPTGIITPINRRYELLSWAAEADSRYIIEDDYDSEFRLSGKPIPSLQSIDVIEKVIYINTFTKSLASTIRISYMILPPHLLKKFHRELSFYSCTVSNFEQYTLARFLRDGYFEKHINRMRKYYKNQRDTILSCIRKNPRAAGIRITEENAGLHFLIHFPSGLTDDEIISRAEKRGIRISALTQYDLSDESSDNPELIPADSADPCSASVSSGPSASVSSGPSEVPAGSVRPKPSSASAVSRASSETDHTLVVNYSGLEPEIIPEAVDLLIRSITE